MTKANIIEHIEGYTNDIQRKQFKSREELDRYIDSETINSSRVLGSKTNSNLIKDTAAANLFAISVFEAKLLYKKTD